MGLSPATSPVGHLRTGLCSIVVDVGKRLKCSYLAEFLTDLHAGWFVTNLINVAMI